MAGTSDQAVSDYLDNLFLEDCLPPVATISSYTPCDTVDLGCRLQACEDPFALMSMADASPLVLWQALLHMLLLGRSLPPSHLKDYVFKQSQVLYARSRVNAGSR